MRGYTLFQGGYFLHGAKQRNTVAENWVSVGKILIVLTALSGRMRQIAKLLSKLY